MASSATRPAINLPRSVTGSILRGDPAARIMPAALTRRLQHVPDAADRMDERVTARVDLLAQVADVQLDSVRLAAEVVVPDPVQDLRLGQHPARVAHHEAQQLELGSGQVDQVPG